MPFLSNDSSTSTSTSTSFPSSPTTLLTPSSFTNTSLLTLYSEASSTLLTNIDPLSISTTNNFSPFISNVASTTPLTIHSTTTSYYSLSENFMETSIGSFQKISPPYLFTPNSTGSQLNNVLSSYTGDISGCLANCSNQGSCILNSLQQYTCQCNQYKTGKSCQTDLRPCSSNPCLNNGTCSNIMNNNETAFHCTCQSNLYYGTCCENKVDLCQNNTDICIKGQGYCVVNGSQPSCKCLKDYSGIKCEIQSSSIIVTKAIVNATSIIAIVVLVSFVILILCFDFTKYFLMAKNKQSKQTPTKKIARRFHYTP